MEKVALLQHLRALLERVPDWDSYSDESREHQQWIAQSLALISRWNQLQETTLRIQELRKLRSDWYWSEGLNAFTQTIQNAIADLERCVELGPYTNHGRMCQKLLEGQR